MATTIEKSGKNVEEALKAALAELGAGENDVDVEVLENPSKGFLGIIGVKLAKVRVTLKEKISPEVEPEKISNFEVVEEIKPEEKMSEEVQHEENIPTAEEKTETTEENISEVAEENFNRDEVIERGKKFLSEVFAAMKIEVEINSATDESLVLFDLVGKNLGILIGKHGQTLDSLQYLLNLAANKPDAPQKLHFILDVENYRQRRTETLKNLARGVAQQVWKTRKEIKLEPMNRHERRIIHTALQDNNKVETHSTGEEPYRCIVVSPKRRVRK